MPDSKMKLLTPGDTDPFFHISQQELTAEEKRYYLFFKRAIDIIFSFLFILFVFSWLAPLLGIIIKCSSRGPVFFKQKRMGYKNKIFVCFKFRTMYVNNFADTRQAELNDPRITKVGNFLRKSGLDELPQFLNVLAGDMSIIGPRPFMLSDYNKFLKMIPGYAFRNSVRPGITGLAQVKGFHGRTENTKQIIGRYFWDSYYVKHVGFFTDLSVSFQTVGLVLKRRNKMHGPSEPVAVKKAIIKKIEDHPAQPSLSKLRY
ncbi:MAG: sugar transferase [Bacteroidetes bacterium]|nr:sugar transferase [Bacteroidota bacterium]